MMDYIKDLVAALAALLNCVPGAMMAVSMYYSMKSTAFGVAAASAGLAAFGNVSSLSFQPESLVLLRQISGNRRERIMIACISSVLLFLLGVTGTVKYIVDIIGQGAMSALLAGMGIVIIKAAFDIQKQEKTAGAVSIIFATAAYMITKDLIITVVISCALSTVAHVIISRKNKTDADAQEPIKPELIKPVFKTRMLLPVLSLTALQITSIIAYGTVNAQLAGVSADPNGLAVCLGISSTISSIFSGAPLAPIISSTASAPHPILSAVMFAALAVILLLTGVLQKISKYVPQQSICGFLFVLGALVIFPDNALQAITICPLAAGIAIAATAFLDPIYGMLVGAIAFRICAL